MTHRFDEFMVDSRTRRLLRGEAEVHLSPKAFDLLLQLVENHTRAMSKAELHEKLWPSTFVLETNLAGLVAEIRRALDDAADQPRYIRTMQRFGYWFIGKLQAPLTGDTTVKPSARFWLVWETRQIALSEGENILGRGADAGIWIDAPGVSRHHAQDSPRRTERAGRGSREQERHLPSRSAHHCPAILADGDQIRLGPVLITFRIPPPAASTDTAHS